MNSLASTKPLEVDIEISDPIPTDAESEADLEGLLAMSKVSAQDIKKLKAVGIHVKRQGILETQRGMIYVTQAWMLGVTGELKRLIHDKLKKEEGKDVPTDEVCKLVDQLAKLAGKQAELSAVMLSHEPKVGGEPPTPTAPPNAAFPAGAIVVGGNAQAHFHQAPEKTVAKAPGEA